MARFTKSKFRRVRSWGNGKGLMSGEKAEFETGCEIATLILGRQSQCGKDCPFEQCLYDRMDDALGQLISDIVRAMEASDIKAPTGRRCPYRKLLYCQEGFCRTCGIYLNRREK
jgi:hypothetical protein